MAEPGRQSDGSGVAAAMQLRLIHGVAEPARRRPWRGRDLDVLACQRPRHYGMLVALARRRAGALGMSALRRHGPAGVHSVVANWRPWRDRGHGVLVCQQQTRYGIPVAFAGGLAVAGASVQPRHVAMPAT